PKIFRSGCVSGPAAMKRSWSGRSTRCSVSAPPCAERLCVTCLIGKRVIGVGGARGFECDDDGLDRRQAFQGDVFAGGAQRLATLRSPHPQAEKATGGPVFRSPRSFP